MTVKSPLRYPGGKTRAIKHILPYIPADITEYTDLMVGGGSVFFAVKQKFPNLTGYTINDINSDLYSFWINLKHRPNELSQDIKSLKNRFDNGRELYKYLLSNELDSAYTAAKFFILNRITFSGLCSSGGYSQQAFEKRFTDSSIDRLLTASKMMHDTTIRNCDYRKILSHLSSFVYVDPPYRDNKKSRLYGTSGDLHLNFNHEELADNLRKSSCRWMLSYNNDPYIKNLYHDFNIVEYTLIYGMSKEKTKTELLIMNY